MPIETMRLDLGDGDFAEIYCQTRHGTSRKIQELYYPYMSKPKVLKVINSRQGTEQDRLAKIRKIISESAEALGANDIMILGQVKAWSFGELTQAVLDEIPEPKVERILAEVNRLADLPLAKSGVGE